MASALCSYLFGGCSCLPGGKDLPLVRQAHLESERCSSSTRSFISGFGSTGKNADGFRRFGFEEKPMFQPVQLDACYCGQHPRGSAPVGMVEARDEYLNKLPTRCPLLLIEADFVHPYVNNSMGSTLFSFCLAPMMSTHPTGALLSCQTLRKPKGSLNYPRPGTCP